jgi:hypothetical protein
MLSNELAEDCTESARTEPRMRRCDRARRVYCVIDMGGQEGGLKDGSAERTGNGANAVDCCRDRTA